VIFLFIGAYWLYIDGLNTFVRMGIDFGLSMGFSSRSLMVALLVVQFVAFPSALLFGILAGRFGAVKMIFAAIAVYIVVTGAGMLLMKTAGHFILLGAATGVGQGGIQALSRSYFAKLIPAEESAEYFGFFNIVSRFAIIGPSMVGGITLFLYKTGAAPHTASRFGMASSVLLFVAGGVLLYFSTRAALRTPDRFFQSSQPVPGPRTIVEQSQNDG
jgi:MFS transporter, UMF1 family